NAQRKTVRIAERRPEVAAGDRRTAADRFGEGGTGLMSYVFFIPGPLRELAGNRGQVRVDGRAASVSDALSLLWATCPGARELVITEAGEVRQHVNIFVDGESIRDASGLATRIRDGAEIFILPALSGG